MIDINIDNLIKCLGAGDVLRLPTDTVYGYICDAENKNAVAKIFEMKKRDEKKPLGVFVKDLPQFYDLVDGGKEGLREEVIDVIEKNWPGALTVICKKNPGVLEGFNEGLTTIGVRIPKDETVLSILERYGKPLAQTSANISGEKDEPVMRGGMASTIIDVTSGKIKVVREGSVKI